MIDIEQAGEVVLSLRSMHFFRALDGDALSDLSRAFVRARDLDHAQQAAEMLKETLVEVPAPAHIAQALAAIPEPAAPPRDRTCRTCRGSGYANSWHLQVESPQGSRSMRPIRCHTCTERGGECQRLIVPDDKPPEIRGLFYCQARTKQIKLPVDLGGGYTGVAFYDSAAPCGDCDFGRQRGFAYAQREAEQAAKRDRRNAQ